MGSPPSNVSTKSVPRTAVPEVPDGVIVTSIVVVAPGARLVGVKLVAGFVDASSRSPVGEVMLTSNARDVAAISNEQVPAGAPAGYGPNSDGEANQKPGETAP